MNENIIDILPQSVLARSVSVRKLPENLNETDLHLFAHELKKEIPAVQILELKDVKISAEGILFQDKRILTESFAFPENFKKWKKRSVLKTYLNNFLLRKCRNFNEAVIWVTDDWSKGYFHWLCDVLPRLVVAQDMDNTILLLPNQFKSLEFVRASLEIFNVKKIEYIGENEVVLCPKVYFPTPTAASGDFNEPIIKQVRKKFENLPEHRNIQTSERIYISRSRALKRKVVNEDETIKILSEYAIEIMQAEDFTFREQISKFSAARYLVSSHGAGLTNMLFMPDGGSVLELRKNDDNINNCYFNMSSALNLKYYYQLCDSPDKEDAHKANLIVDVNLLKKNLELMLKQGEK